MAGYWIVRLPRPASDLTVHVTTCQCVTYQHRPHHHRYTHWYWTLGLLWSHVTMHFHCIKLRFLEWIIRDGLRRDMASRDLGIEILHHF